MADSSSRDDLRKRIADLERQLDRWKKIEAALAEMKSTNGGAAETADAEFRTPDIDALKAAETALRKYEQIVSSSTDLMSLVDADYTYQAVNDAFLRAYAKSRDDVVGRTMTDVFGPEMFNRNFKKNIDRCLQGEELHHQDWMSFPGLGRRYIDFAYYPFIDENQTVAGVVANARDVTHMKTLEVQLQQAQKMEAVATLAGGIAHQFNNALAGILGYIELLEMEDASRNGKLGHYLEAMKSSARRMADLTNQLLAYARRGKYQLTKIALNDFVKDTLAVLQHAIDASILIETDLAENTFPVEADGAQLQMVLAGILDNAMEAIDKEGIIHVSTGNCWLTSESDHGLPIRTPGQYVCLSVRDNGKGMETKIRQRIFEPFFTTKLHGRGLSMAAVYGIVKNHNGWITVDSEPDNGTTVRIYLPAVSVSKPEIRECRPAYRTKTETILIVEDEDTVRSITRVMLEKLGYRVIEAQTGSEAIERINLTSGPIKMAILDFFLPDMRGDRVLEMIRSIRPEMNVMISSGYALEEVEHQLNVKAESFIQKPYSFAMLTSKVKELLGDLPDAAAGRT
jgi:PAS domain S-box-containing protein